MSQRHRLPHLSTNSQAEPTDEVLTEVDDGAPRRRSGDGNRHDKSSTAHGWPGRGDEGREVPFDRSHTNPIAVIVIWSRPARAFQAGVISFTVIDIAGKNGPLDSTPGFVGDDALGGAIGIVDLKLGEPREAGAIDVAAPAAEAETTSVPAIAQTSGSAAGGCSWSIPEPGRDRRR